MKKGLAADLTMVAPFGGFLVRALQVVEKVQEYESTPENFKSTIQALNPLVEEIKQYNEMMDLPAHEDIDRLMDIMAQSRELIRKPTTHLWNFFLNPINQSKLEKREKELGRLMVQMSLRILKDIQSKVSDSVRLTISGDQTNNGTPTDRDLRVSEFPVGLEGPLKNQLKFELLKDGGKQVLNLTGMAGLGKTTLAKHLCRDLQVRGKFNDNIVFETLGSQFQSNGHSANELQKRLSEFGENPTLLVLDDVWLASKNLVEQFRVQISSDSKILMTSRFDFKEFGTPYLMKPLGHDDAITLFLRFVQPNDIISSYNDGDEDIRKILLQIVEGCKGLPLALKFIGGELRGKPIEFWQKVVTKWSQGHSIVDSNTELLSHLENSFHVLEDESIKECFMDLGLFPEDQRIPVTALIDMWIELHKLNEDGIDALALIYELAYRNFADMMVTRKAGSDADNSYNNHFLMQHGILRELAICISSQETFEKRKRLIMDINGNNCPEWWPQQQQHEGITAFIPKQVIASQQQSVAAHILSISTDQKITPDWCNLEAAEAKILVLNLHTEKYTLPEFMKKMRNLKVLIVINYYFHSTELKNFKLLGFLSNLTRIRLQQVSIPYLCILKNVKKLSLYMCEVKAAFENSSIQISKAMPSLVDLNIDYCQDMVKLPFGLCDIVTLKKLSISGCHKLAALPQEIGKLENLELLRVSYCANFEEMPESVTELQGLNFLDISYCVSLRKLPNNIGEMRNLRKLYMTGCLINELPDSVMKMEHLKSVICDKETYVLWEVIQHIYPSLNIKAEDTTLDNRGSEAIIGTSLDNSKVKEQKLHSIMFVKMPQPKFLDTFSSTSEEHHWYLPQGTHKSLLDEPRYLCWDERPLKSLPLTFSAEILVELDMEHIKTRKLWDGMQNLVNLKYINLSDSQHLMELPDFSKALNLEEAFLSCCSSLRKVHPSILSLHKLEVLVLDWCKSLTSVRNDIHLRSLRYLSLYKCSRLKEFSVTSENMITLNLVKTAINELPSSICCMSKLESLNLSGCKRLKNLPSNLFDSLRSLRWLWLDDCCNIFELSDNINMSSSIDRLTINGIAMGGLSESIKHFSSLKFLLFNRCRRLQCLPELPPSIRALSATDCSSLETVNSVAIECTTFENCVKLDEYSVKAILAYVMVHINKSLSGLENCNPECNPAYGMYLESRVPEWFKYRIAHAGSITIDLSSAPLSVDWGLLFCFIFSPSQREKKSHIRCTGCLRIINHQSVDEGNDEDDADDNDICNVFYQMDVTNLTSDHVFLYYTDDFCSILRRNKRESTATENSKILYKMKVLLLDNDKKKWQKHCKEIKECGVCPTYVSEYQNFLKKMEKSQASACGMGVGCSY